MKNKKIVLEEYNSDFNYKIKHSGTKISFNRVAFIFFVSISIFLIFTIKIIMLIGQELSYKKDLIKDYEFRSSIVDRNGNILAKSVVTKNIGINPKEVINKEKLLINLQIIFPKKNFDKIKKKLNKNNFFYIEKQVSQEQYKQLFLLGDKSIKEESKILRIYPQGSLFSHILGQIDDNNNGVSGIEKYYDHELKSSENPIKLSLDANLQYLLREELLFAESIFNNIGSAVILMDINNGEILSMISMPDFDLNKREKIVDKNYINRASKAVYELGSVFKLFTFTAGLNENLIDVDTKFINLEKRIKCGKNIISEYDEEIPSNLTAEEILIRSGNIGSVRIAQKIGIDKFKSFLNELGITDKIEFDIEEVGTPLPFNWGKCKLATTSFGHGITTTPLQLSKAYAIISNGGYLITPTLLKQENFNKYNKNKILNEGISLKVNSALRKVVSSKDGTAGFADIPGYEVGGKTGTAQKTLQGKYSKEKVNTFVAVFPSNNPKYVLLVLLDEPKVNKEYVYNYRDGSGFKYKGNWRNTAGWTSVEIAGRMIEKIGPILATKY